MFLARLRVRVGGVDRERLTRSAGLCLLSKPITASIKSRDWVNWAGLEESMSMSAVKGATDWFIETRVPRPSSCSQASWYLGKRLWCTRRTIRLNSMPWKKCREWQWIGRIWSSQWSVPCYPKLRTRGRPWRRKRWYLWWLRSCISNWTELWFAPPSPWRLCRVAGLVSEAREWSTRRGRQRDLRKAS